MMNSSSVQEMIANVHAATGELLYRNLQNFEFSNVTFTKVPLSEFKVKILLFCVSE